MKRIQKGSSVVSFLAIGAALTGAVGCSSKSHSQGVISNKNLVQAGNPNLVKTLTDGNQQVTVMARDAFESKVANHELDRMNSANAARVVSGILDRRRTQFDDIGSNWSAAESSNTSLLFGLPFSML